ncbi:9693_t:CDS:2 [Cetraspora pellucida]|uniref:9693_t:CDS:1 n=1 Tax=Cetraspora pellucida TaxID=1433469 RepID=A0ACA9KH65_9GLOM|nr:9693_t:CDS:2 [Cetraspora pellucida]
MLKFQITNRILQVVRSLVKVIKSKYEDDNDTITVFCTWCKAAKKVNQFTISTQSLRKQTFERHFATNAKSITEDLERFIIAKLLNIKNIFHFGSDGASSTMLRCRTGVAARLKKYNPYLTKNHCIAHQLHLASQDAAEQVPYFKKYDALVKGIYLYFSNSYKRLLTLKLVQNTLEEPKLVLLNIVSTRWLLFSNVIHNFYRSLKSVKEALLEESTTN